MCLWKWDQPTPQRMIWGAHPKFATSLLFDRDGKTLWTGSEDGFVKRWDITAGTREMPKEVAASDLKIINHGNGRVRDLVVSQGTLWALGWGETELVATLDSQTLKPDEAQVKRNGCLLLGDRLCLSPDRRTLAGATKNLIRLMDTQSSTTFRELVDTSVDISHELDQAHHPALEFSPTGASPASCRGSDGFVGLWDVAARGSRQESPRSATRLQQPPSARTVDILRCPTSNASSSTNSLVVTLPGRQLRTVRR